MKKEVITAANRQSNPSSFIKEKPDALLERAPSAKPPFTLGQIKKAIPPHCFQRSVIRSFAYLISDLIIVFLLYYVSTNYIHLLPKNYLSYLAWSVYGFLQGCVAFGLWVTGHECGHHAFSDYQWLDDTVGFIVHTSIFTPYFSWKYSHRRHHSNTNSMERDETHIPKTNQGVRWYHKYMNNTLGRILLLLITLTLGWPLYLVFNASGRNYDRFSNHYNPYGRIYTERERLQIYISDAGILAVSYGLFHLITTKGLFWVLCVYLVPLFVMNVFIVITTYLQHIHPSIPHYDSSEWDWLRGALCTVDRDFGILNMVFHDVNDTHVVHHLFSSIPHYHAMEATKAIRPVLGEYYRFDGTPFYKALWRNFKECIYVEADEGDHNKGVLWFKNKF